MAAPGNLSFEDGTATPGAANLWSIAYVNTFQTWADYDAALKSFEDFEGWWPTSIFAFVGYGTDLTVFTTTSISATPKHVENFEELWSSNHLSVSSLDGLETFAVYGGPESFESFESNTWNGAVNYLSAFVGVGTDLTLALYNAGADAFESFDSNSWNAGVNYKSTFTGIGADLTAAVYAGAPPFEDFEGVRPTLPTTLDPTTDIFTSVGHQFLANDAITFDGSTLPDAVFRGVIYYVINIVGNTFQVAAAPAGAPIAFTTTGSTDLTSKGDPALFWTDELL